MPVATEPRRKPQDVSPIDVDKVDRGVRSSIRKQVIDLINKNPELALRLLRAWKDNGR